MTRATVIGVDVGTTATKVVAYSPDGTAIGVAERGYPLHSPQPGWAEQDPDQIVAAVLDAVAEAAAAVPARSLVAVGLGSAMHSLIGLDADDRPLTPALTYADSRSWPQALRLRRERGLDLYHATGTPLHPMSPLAKLCWFAEEQPELFRRVRRWISVKEYLSGQLCGSTAVDHAIASATGMFNLRARDWDDEALSAAGVSVDQLGEPVPTTTVIGALPKVVAERLGVDASTQVVIGASDGVLANLGVGALRPGEASLSIGTSGAVRVATDQPTTDPDMRTFCYALLSERWVSGGAISNGGLVLRWLNEQILGTPDLEGITAEAAVVAPGSDGVLMVPYLTAERAPRWSPLHGAVLFGLHVEHRRGHVIRAALEGVALQLRLVADAMRDGGADLRQLRVTGGFVASDLWLQIVADVLGSQLDVPSVEEPVAYGAALLALRGVELIDDLDNATRQTGVARSVTPDENAARRYDGVAARYGDLVERLEPLLTDPAGWTPASN